MKISTLLRLIRPVPYRLRWLRSRIDPSTLGLEIGPCHNPVAPRALGYQVEIVDHLDTDGLRAKFAPHGIDVSRIERVDHVWSGQPLPDLVGRHRRFSWVVASHVAEHVPDLVRFLSDCLELLEPRGRLVLALPDHRRCFDRNRQPSSLSQVLEAWESRRRRPSPGMVAEHHLRAVSKGGRLSWRPWWPGGIRRVHSDAEARDVFRAALSDDIYRDVHAWCFTPDTFRQLVEDLAALDLLRCEVVEEPTRSGYEFFIVLAPTPSSPGSDRPRSP